MRLSLSQFLRPLFWGAVALSVVAVGIGRYVPRRSPSRLPAIPRYHGINGHLFASEEYVPLFLDRETGRVVRAAIPDGDVLDYGACSPWSDERGQHHIVGRWKNQTCRGTKGLPSEFGLARYTFPEGRVIERIPLELMPAGPPCWVPGLEPRILFVAGDGRIYRYSFDEQADLSPIGGERSYHARPEPLTWHVPSPGIGPVYLKDLAWPTAPEFGGRLVVSLSYLVRLDGIASFVGPQLWWLRLNGEGTAIESAGRLSTPRADGPVPDSDVEERFPTFASTPGGGLTIAYLGREQGHGPWGLRVGPVATEPGDGPPTIRREDIRTVTGNCLATSPIFSLDGRWVYGIVQHPRSTPEVIARRVSSGDYMASAAPFRSGPIPVPGRGPRPVAAGRRASREVPDFARYVASRLVERGETLHAGR